MELSFEDHIRKILLLVHNIVIDSPILDKDTGVVNVKGDNTIMMDKKLEDAIIDYIKNNDLPFNIFSEEIGTIEFHPNPTHLIVFDPLDGSTNYKLGKNLLPYGLLIACYRGLQPKIKDIIASGGIEHITNKGWLYDGKVTKTFDGEEVDLNKEWTISKSTPVYLDLYYKKAYEKFSAFPEKVHVRWNGSNISSLLYIMSGVGAVMGSSQMRPEEIGAVVSLIRGAGGLATDLEGNDLGEYDFSTESTYPLLAGNKDVVEAMLQYLKEFE
jgi:fructose-1,6-bisphosphatase/inositol monophosphatase family enzyme